MNIFKTIIQCWDDGLIYFVDTIEWQGKFWLVPEWLAGPKPRTEMPARLIGLDGLPVQKARPPYQADFELMVPLTRETLSGDPTQGFVIIERPDIVRGMDTLH